MRFDPFKPRVSTPDSCRESLLCDRVTIPTVPFFWGTNEFLRLKWLEAGQVGLSQGGAQACQICFSALDQTPVSESAICNFLFDAAHQLLAGNYQTAADHCIQKGLCLLTGDSQKSCRIFSGRLWLVMATSALIARNPESCDVWLRQARRSVLLPGANERTLSQELLHWNGDWLATKACLQAGAGDLRSAESLLSSAHQFHLRAQAFTSAAKDLLLRSRGRLLEEQWDAAESDLEKAQILLCHSDSEDENWHRIGLRQVVENELIRIRTKTESLSAAQWN